MSVPSEICESFRLEIAEVAKPYGWKYLKSTHTLKKQVRDIVFEILLRSSWHNSSSSARVDMGFFCWCRSISKKYYQDCRTGHSYCRIRYASHILGDKEGQKAAKIQLSDMDEMKLDGLKRSVRDYLDNREKYQTARSKGLYYVPSDIMYLVDHGMIALDENDQIIFPE